MNNKKCTMGECPFCLALYDTNHSGDCSIFKGFENDEDLADIVDLWSELTEDYELTNDVINDVDGKQRKIFTKKGV